MNDESLIVRYLLSLNDALRVSARRRAGILRETMSHLEDRTAAIRTSGAVESPVEDALTSFGDPRSLAGQFEPDFSGRLWQAMRAFDRWRVEHPWAGSLAVLAPFVAALPIIFLALAARGRSDLYSSSYPFDSVGARQFLAQFGFLVVPLVALGLRARLIQHRSGATFSERLEAWGADHPKLHVWFNWRNLLLVLLAANAAYTWVLSRIAAERKLVPLFTVEGRSLVVEEIPLALGAWPKHFLFWLPIIAVIGYKSLAAGQQVELQKGLEAESSDADRYRKGAFRSALVVGASCAPLLYYSFDNGPVDMNEAPQMALLSLPLFAIVPAEISLICRTRGWRPRLWKRVRRHAFLVSAIVVLVAFSVLSAGALGNIQRARIDPFHQHLDFATRFRYHNYEIMRVLSEPVRLAALILAGPVLAFFAAGFVLWRSNFKAIEQSIMEATTTTGDNDLVQDSEATARGWNKKLLLLLVGLAVSLGGVFLVVRDEQPKIETRPVSAETPLKASVLDVNLHHQPAEAVSGVGPDRRLVAVQLKVTNSDSRDSMFTIDAVRLLDSNDVAYSPSPAAGPDPQLRDVGIVPGGTAEGWIAFQVPRHSRGFRLVFNGGVR